MTAPDRSPLPRALVLMGVSGCGKTAVGRALARRTGARFIDADDLHDEASRRRMAAGIPMTDADRQPWLERVRREAIDAAPAGSCCIVACSALRRPYRRTLTAGAPDVAIVFLDGSRELIASRLAARTGHFMPAGLLDSQFATLERPGPDEAIAVPIDGTPEEISAEILAKFAASDPG